MPARPFLAVTLGDPAGIGPWVGAATAADRGLRRRCRPFLIGDAGFLARVLPRKSFHPIAEPAQYKDRPGLVNVLHVPEKGLDRLALGRPQRAGGLAAAAAIEAAVKLARARRVAGVVTGPVSKESLKLAGVPYPGHTEMLAALSGVKDVEMVMAAGPLRTVLVTRHLPLMNVSRTLTARTILGAVRRVDRWARKSLGLRRPRWAVCGLNPHAGDNGLLGDEEKKTVGPAVTALRRAGVDARGPLPADVAWSAHAKGEVDLVASLYHDQGMIPLKTMFPRQLINITVGLPWVRTSPGHGTAFDVAAGPRPAARADAAPTLAAAHAALDLASRL